MKNIYKSEQLFKKANQYIPGGVNSPVRAFKSVGGSPLFIKKAKGAYVYDVDDNRYIDYVGSWGPMILGHADDDVIEAVQKQALNGLSYGAPCEQEIFLAEEIIKLIPSVEQIRFVSSGTEATMSAIRLARGFTNRDKIIKFAGCYHGHADHLLVEAGSGALTLGTPNSPGIPKDFAKHTLTASFNDIDSVNQLFDKYKNEIAAIIIEPVAGNMNLIKPTQNFLQKIRKACNKNNALLIFDEVMTGFRVSLNCAQGLYGITPDLTTFGKVIGGGMPVGAFGGRKEIMQYISPCGPVYQAGTLSGNPIAMTAGLVTLQKVQQPNFYQNIEQKTQQLCLGLQAIANKYKVDFHTEYQGSMFGLFFTDKKSINSFEEVKTCNSQRFNHFFHYMLNNGIYFAPSSFEAGFMSIAHSDEDIKTTLDLAEEFFSA